MGRQRSLDIARLALFMFAVKPNMGPPGGLPKGGPVYFVGQILPAMMLGKIGWALGYGMKGVEQEYIGFKSINDPLFKSEKLMLRASPLLKNPNDTDRYLEAVNKWGEKIQMSSMMAYTSSWGEANPNGGKGQVDAFLEDTKLDVPRDPRDVLCKLWARGACKNPRCPYRHAFATDGERRWSEGAKLRRLAELKREGDARDPWAERAEDASRSHKNANFDDAEKRAHAARHALLRLDPEARVGHLVVEPPQGRALPEHDALFERAESFAAFDDAGIPTEDAGGTRQ